MKDISQRVVESLDGNLPELLPHLPYLLQDLREIGSDPVVMLDLIRGNVSSDQVNILDLGCGKGAVTVYLAKNLNCKITGIDYIEEFIESAKLFADAEGVAERCRFIQGDGRMLISEFSGMDIVVLGAVGPLLGDIHQSLRQLRSVLKTDGFVILDDGYLEEGYSGSYDRCPDKQVFFQQIENAGFEVIDEEIFDRSILESTDRMVLENIKRRAAELALQYPEKKKLFDDYVASQVFEFQMLETDIVTGTWLLQMKSEY